MNVIKYGHVNAPDARKGCATRPELAIVDGVEGTVQSCCALSYRVMSHLKQLVERTMVSPEDIKQR